MNFNKILGNELLIDNNGKIVNLESYLKAHFPSLIIVPKESEVVYCVDCPECPGIQTLYIFSDTFQCFHCNKTGWNGITLYHFLKNHEEIK